MIDQLAAPNTSEDLRLFVLTVRRHENGDRFADHLFGLSWLNAVHSVIAYSGQKSGPYGAVCGGEMALGSVSS